VGYRRDVVFPRPLTRFFNGISCLGSKLPKHLRFACVGYMLNFFKAFLLFFIASLQSLFHQGTGSRWGWMDECGMEDLAAAMIVSVQ
jgi:hypothetical protein